MALRSFSSTTTAAMAALLFLSASSRADVLVNKHFDLTNIPYQVDLDHGIRGTQFGYNICNSTTENQDSKCQTAFVNAIDDFCLWGQANPWAISNDLEAKAIAYCTKPGHGTRLIPDGALTGIQFMRTPSYVQVVGYINQTYLNYDPQDTGGETDPHGTDDRGNPIGGLLFTNAFTKSPGQFKQAVEWHSWMGANFFCIKACDPTNPDAARLCEHIYDRLGCNYNAPSNAHDRVFESCEGDDQDFPGVYVQDGKTLTYSQPPESEGPITSMPFVARVPASSNCVPAKSEELFVNLPKFTEPPPFTPTTSASQTEFFGTVTRTRDLGAPTNGAVGGRGPSGSGVASTGVGIVGFLVGLVAML